MKMNAEERIRTAATDAASSHRSSSGRSRLAARTTEPVADRAHRVDRGGAVRAAQLAAQVADVDVDDVRRRIVLVAPHGAQDLLAGDDPAAVAQQVGEQF